MDLGRFRVGLRVVDVATGCTITSEPRVEPYGDRVFECIDPCGYVWEISQPVGEVPAEDATDAVREEWFGPDT